MIGHRRAAVALFELHEVDRNWILEALPANDRGLLLKLLDELKELGFARDASLSTDSSALASDNDQDAPMEVLKHASDATMLAILENEPAILIARLLQIEEWPWKNSILEQMGMHSVQIKKLMETDHVIAPAAANFILVEVAHRIQTQSKDGQSSTRQALSAGAGKDSFFNRLKKLFP